MDFKKTSLLRAFLFVTVGLMGVLMGALSFVTVNKANLTVEPVQALAATATSSPVYYTLHIAVQGNGVVTGPYVNCTSNCGVPHAQGSGITLTATPSAGYVFQGWGGVCSGTGTCSFKYTQNATTTALFTPPTYNLSVSVQGNGVVTGSNINCPGTCMATPAAESVQTLTATPASGYMFTGWSGACSGTDVCSVTMGSDTNVTANFVQITYTLSVALTGSGTVTGSGINCPSGACSVTNVAGTPITLSATPASGYYFNGWSGACSGKTSCSLTLNDNTNVSANFVAVPKYTVTTVVQGNGTITAPYLSCTGTCTLVHSQGTQVTFTATPAMDYVFSGWSGACTSTDPTCSYTYNADTTLTALFNPKTYNLSVSTQGGNGTVSGAGLSCPPNCTGTVNAGSTATLNATPATGFDFVGWSGACSGTGACSLSAIESDQSVTAIFKTHYNDGYSNAPAGTPQYPNLLSGYAVRAPWNVAGVDYAVGPHTPPTGDPATISLAGVSVNTTTHLVTITGNDVTLAGYDFTKGGSWSVRVNGANAYIKDNKFAAAPSNGNIGLIFVQPNNAIAASGLHIAYNQFEAYNASSTMGAHINILGNVNNVLIEYNYFKNTPADFVDLGMSPAATVRFNLFDSYTSHAGAHSDAVQEDGTGTTTTTIVFNTMYQPSDVTTKPGLVNSSFELAAQPSGLGYQVNGEIGNNTIVYPARTYGDTLGYSLQITAGTKSTNVNSTIHDNYLDTTGSFGAFYPGKSAGVIGATFPNNINMVTGATFVAPF
jgi:uncharacterized repeat protein (TIGR02543 family)